ncbi:MAG TPA: hypothetical protein DDW76_29635 [Cyanobacteria bacterium UBA11369]|nr:hypothetical protein [Cyanobacteria bacterium UBA11371]HBE35495.1 hypothetical protein [Cyanobacteria bacterium UBA11368]HBE52809.1 hypothetical protein [Cyanobacteria bacterium UBA11369]
MQILDFRFNRICIFAIPGFDQKGHGNDQIFPWKEDFRCRAPTVVRRSTAIIKSSLGNKVCDAVPLL